MKKTIYFDMDNVLVDFLSGVEMVDEETRNSYKKYDEIPGIFSLMKPKKEAVEAFNLLSQKYEVFILSTAPWENPTAWSDKLQWVKKHLGKNAYKRLILTHRKDLHMGEYLIDDNEKNGAAEFKGELIRFGSEKFKNWNAVKNYLLPENGE